MSWSLIKLSDVCEINIGKTPARAKPEYWGAGHPWLSIADMNQGRKLYFTKEEITELGKQESKIKLVPKGTVLFSFKLSIGKIGITQRDMYTNEAIAALPIKNKSILCEEYLLYALSRIDAGKTTDRAVMGATLNKKKLAELKIPLPPLKEQKRIAAILDKADAIRRKRQQAIDLTDQLLRSVFLDMFGDPITNPKGWETKSIEQLVVDKKYSLKRGPFGGALKKEIFVDSGYLVYEQYHALNNDFSFQRYFINEEKFNELKAFEVNSGDIIISCSGVNLGKLAIVPNGSPAGIINQALLKLTLNESIMLNEMFLNIFVHPNFKSKFFGEQRGSGVPNFPPMNTFKEFKFITPPIELQNKFVDFVHKAENNLSQKLRRSDLDIEMLFSSLTQQAFKGKLSKQTEVI